MLVLLAFLKNSRMKKLILYLVLLISIIIIIKYITDKKENVDLCKKDKFYSIYNVYEERVKIGLPIIDLNLYLKKNNKKNSSYNYILRNENSYLPIEANYYCFSSSEELKFKSKEGLMLTVQYYFQNKSVTFILKDIKGDVRFLESKEAYSFFKKNKYLGLFHSTIFYNSSIPGNGTQ